MAGCSGKLGSMPASDLAALRAFRTDLHGCFPRRADALIELVDALLTAGPVASLPHLSLQAAHRRGWGSLYDALTAGALDEAALQVLLRWHVASDERTVYAIDQGVGPRCDAEASPDRVFYSHPPRHSAGQPIVAGWAYQFVAQLGFVRESWTAPVDVQRVLPAQDANEVATQQIEALLSRLEEGEAVPLFVFDLAAITQNLSKQSNVCLSPSLRLVGSGI